MSCFGRYFSLRMAVERTWRKLSSEYKIDGDSPISVCAEFAKCYYQLSLLLIYDIPPESHECICLMCSCCPCPGTFIFTNTPCVSKGEGFLYP